MTFAVVLAGNGGTTWGWGAPPREAPPKIGTATAVETAQRWLRALTRGDLPAAAALSALPFTIVGRFFVDPRIDPSGRARTPAQLEALLGRLARNAFVAGEFSAYLLPPSRDLRRRVNVTNERARVSFEYDSNWLADGTYVDAVIDVVIGRDGLPVVSAALFRGYSLD